VNREQVTRNDFPADGDGYDRASVDAHLSAVAAWTAALEAQIAALEVEREALRRNAAPPAAGLPRQPEPADPTRAEPARVEPETPVSEPAGPDAEEGSQDEVSARLVATKMALDGANRDAIVAHLSASYDLADAGGVVDDVLARLG
jgi:hypothetical protein